MWRLIIITFFYLSCEEDLKTGIVAVGTTFWGIVFVETMFFEGVETVEMMFFKS